MVLHARALNPDDAPERVLGLSVDRLLQDWRAAHGRALAYLEALDVPEEEHEAIVVAAVERALTRDVWDGGADAIGETLRALREVLVERRAGAAVPSLPPAAAVGIDAFLLWRLTEL